MKTIHWCLLIIAFGILGACSNEADSETPAKPEPVAEEKKEPAKETKTEPKSDKIEITQFAIDMAVDTAKGNGIVEDAAVSVKGDEISMALVVNSASTEEAAKEALDNFARSLTIGLDGKGATKDYYGEVYDQYSVILTAVDSQDNEKAFGAMAKGTHRISW